MEVLVQSKSEEPEATDTSHKYTDSKPNAEGGRNARKPKRGSVTWNPGKLA